MSQGVLSKIAKSGCDYLAASKAGASSTGFKSVQWYSIAGKGPSGVPSAPGTPPSPVPQAINVAAEPSASPAGVLIPAAAPPPPPLSAPPVPGPFSKAPQPPRIPPSAPAPSSPASPSSPATSPLSGPGSLPPPTRSVEGRYAWLGWLIPLIAVPAGAALYWQNMQGDQALRDTFEQDRKAVIASRRPDGAPSVLKAMEGAAAARGKAVPALPTTDTLPPPPSVPATPAELAAEVLPVPLYPGVSADVAPSVDLPTDAKGGVPDASPAAAAAEQASVADTSSPVSGGLDATAPGLVPSDVHAVVPDDVAAAPVDQLPPTPATHAEPPAVPPGPAAENPDVSPDGLLLYAVLAAAAADDSPEAKARRQQAAADAAAFQKVLAKVEQLHQENLELARAEATQSAVEAAERGKKEATVEFQSLLRLHEELAKEQRELEVQQAEKRVTLRANKAMLDERVARGQALDEVRGKVNALSEALDAASGALSSGTASRRITLSILALESDLASGRPLSGNLSLLKRACGDDPLVALALDSVPQEQAVRGVPTRSDLESQLRHMRSTISELSYFPAGSAGMLAHLLAKAATWLKADEGPYVAAGYIRPSDGIDTALARTEQLLVQGDLAGAADVLGQAVQGTTAESATAPWRAGVKARALADQAVAMLRAHASTLAAALD